jgi:hypothetical protein
MKRNIEAMCFLWGTKYPKLYVNRLKNSLKIHLPEINGFHCFTDRPDDPAFDSDVITHDLASFNKLEGIDDNWPLFTKEKILPMDKDFLPGTRKIIFDIDALVHGSLSNYICNNEFPKVTLIKNSWVNRYEMKAHYSNITTPYNSSFVVWDDDAGDWLLQNTIKVWDKLSFSYKSFDKYLYNHYPSDKFNFHPKGIVYTYNFGADFPDDMDEELKRDEYQICLFNTSHGRGKELDEAEGWPLKLWESYAN